MLRTPIVTPLGTVKLTLNGQPLQYSSDELKIPKIESDKLIQKRMVGIKYLQNIKKTDKIVLTLDQNVGNIEFDGDEGWYGSISVKNGTKVGLSFMHDSDDFPTDYYIDEFDTGLEVVPVNSFSTYFVFMAVWGEEKLDDIQFVEFMYI